MKFKLGFWIVITDMPTFAKLDQLQQSEQKDKKTLKA